MESLTRVVNFTRHGVENVVGAHVVMPWKGRTLLGEVRDMRYDSIRGYTFLNVIHMNGESWPVEPCAGCVRVLVRTYES